MPTAKMPGHQPKRHFVPGVWGRSGRAIPDAQVSELDNMIPLRPEVTFPKPDQDEAETGASMLLEAVYWSVGLLSVCCFLLAIWPR